MSGEMLTGQDAPVVSDEAQNLTPEQTNTGTTEAQTDGAEGGKESPVPRTYTEEELRERIERATAKAAAKAERRAFREATQRLHSAATPKEEPTREDFRDDSAYTQAQLEYMAERKADEKLRQREESQKAERMQEALHERLDKAADRYPDFHAVVSNPALPINEAMTEFIADSEHGGEIAYHLGKNPGKAAQIAQMSPVKAARELAKLESELANKPKATPSKAPEPIKPVGNRGPTSASPMPSDDDDIDTWMRKERERLKKLR
jgi:hypothetical protein